MSDNMKLWDSVCKTNPANTKAANVRGNKITAIAPQTQIMEATKVFGIYGEGWGFKDIQLDYAMLDKTGIVVFKGVFFFGKSEFPIITSTSAYKDGAMTKPDADFAKKVETDALTKALSKLGFNADVFMGCYDDVKYVAEMKLEFAELSETDHEWVNAIKAGTNALEDITDPAYRALIEKELNK